MVKANHEWIIINITRAEGEKMDYVYALLENVKDGDFISTKYQC